MNITEEATLKFKDGSKMKIYITSLTMNYETPVMSFETMGREIHPQYIQKPDRVSGNMDFVITKHEQYKETEVSNKPTTAQKIISNLSRKLDL